MQIDIKRGANPATVVASFNANEDTVFTHQLMGEHKITTRFRSPSVLNIRIGDYIEYGGEVFTIGTTPEVTRMAANDLEYNIEFEGEVYRLYNKIMMDEGAADFSYFGTPSDYLNLLLTNINSIDNVWSLGTVYDAIEPQPLSFNNETCREALTRIAELFDLEYYIEGTTINMVQRVGNDINLTLQYGKGNGLYQLGRQKLNDKALVTRLYAFGAQKNLQADYRGGEKRLIFDGNPLESNVATYGVIEGSITFDEVYPHRTGTVTDVPASGDVFSVYDNALDFDINNYLLEGVVAKIVFKTGDLAGYQFEIVSYDPNTYKITFKEFVEENDYKLPNDVVKASVGDQYTLVDIKMPQTYIDAAEAELLSKAQDYLAEQDHPQVTYSFACDEFFFNEFGLDIKIGDKVHIVDVGLGIDTTLRISDVSYPLLYPKRVSATITEGVQYSTVERIIRVTEQTIKELRTVNVTSQENARANQLRMRELQNLVYDPDGYFDTDNIRPQSIETIHLAVGVKSQQFALSGIVFSPNQNSLPANFAWTGGELIHYEIEPNIRTWTIPSGSRNDLVDADPYYIYARMPIVGNQGTIVLDTAALKVDEEAGYYHFLIGVLHSVIDGVRGISLTYGTTEINGKFIRTGTIYSQDGQTYFNLDAGEIGGVIKFAAGSSGYQNLSDIPGANPYFEQGTRLWSYSFGGNEVPENVIDNIVQAGRWGGNVLEVVGNKFLYYKNLIPVDVNRIYKGRFRVRQTVNATNPANQNVYAGVRCYDKDYNYLGNNVYFIATAQLINSSEGWHEYEGTISGNGVGNGAGTVFVSNTAYVRPMFIVNHSGGDGTAEVDGLDFIDITESKDIENSLGALAYDDLVSLAKLDTTIIQGGYIKTSLLDVNAIIVQGGFGDLAFDNTVALAQLDSTIIQGGYIKTSLIDVDTLRVQGDLAKLSEAVKFNSYFELGTRLWSLSYTGEIVPENVNFPIVSAGRWGGKVLEVTGENWIYSSKAIPVDVNRIYKGKFRVRQSVNGSNTANQKIYAGVRCYDKDYNYLGNNVYFIAGAQLINSSEGWHEYEGTISGNGVGNGAGTVFSVNTAYVRPMFIVNYQGGDGVAQVDGLEFIDVTEAQTIENNLGTLAYDDLVSLAKLDTTIIQGGYIKTALIDVDTLIARNVLTSATGRRIQIDGANNRLLFYNASGSEVIRIDDNLGTDDAGNAYSGIRAKGSGSLVSYLSSNGIYSDVAKNSYYNYVGSGYGSLSYGAIIGVLRQVDHSLAFTAGVVGIKDNSLGGRQSFGGYFNSAKIQELSLGVSSNDPNGAGFIMDTGNSDIYLPSNPADGRTIIVRSTDYDIVIYGNGSNIRSFNGIAGSFNLLADRCVIFVYFAGQWQMISYTS